MKRLTQDLYRYQLLINKKRWLRRLARSGKNKKTQSKQSGNYKSVKFPTIIDISDKINRAKLLRSLVLLRSLAAQESGITFDFSKTKLINAGGMILLYSEVSRLTQIFQFRKRCVEPQGERESQVLKHIGLYDKLSHKKSLEISHKNVLCWHKFAGTTADSSNVGKFLDELVNQSSLPTEDQVKLYKGISEAITNALQHAYILPRNDNINTTKNETKWWVFFREQNNNLEIVCCDLGAGIPRTLSVTHNDFYKTTIFRTKRDPYDYEVIEQATKINVSRTKDDYRGKGLPQIISSSCEVLIFSNRGVLKIKNEKTEFMEYKDSILGTVILWKTPLLQSFSEAR